MCGDVERKSDDQLMHVYWKNRTNGRVEDVGAFNPIVGKITGMKRIGLFFPEKPSFSG